MSEEYQVIDLGQVVGADGGFGNITSDYVNDGGDPGVEITMTGEDRAKDFHFEFKNLVNDPLTASEIERIAAGEMVHSSNTANGTSMSLFFAALSQLFAGIAHTHSADDIDSGTFGASRIANDAVTLEKLSPTVRDSLSRVSFQSNLDGVEFQFDETNGTTAIWFKAKSGSGRFVVISQSGGVASNPR